MGIIKAVQTAVGGSLADQWLEVIEPNNMGIQTVFTNGIKIRKGSNVKGTEDTVSNGSVIHVYPNQFMMLVDGGQIVDYTAEEGYYTVNNSSMPSLFNGQLGDTVKETFNRVKFGGQTPTKQMVYYINLQEISSIKFGTPTPMSYFDYSYNADLFVRVHGTYSIKITNPILFYNQAIPKNTNRVDINSINEQYKDEFLQALQTSISRMSMEGTRISHIFARGDELKDHMQNVLDESWKRDRGMEVMSVGIPSISYNEESQKLMNMRAEGAMLSDPSIAQGYMAGSVARGIEAAGANEQGALSGFMGVGMGMNMAGIMGGGFGNNTPQAPAGGPVSPPPQAAPQPQAPAPAASPVAAQPEAVAGVDPQVWNCQCGHQNRGKFCSECGSPKPEPGPWTCSCGHQNKGKFCSECGKPRS